MILTSRPTHGYIREGSTTMSENMSETISELVHQGTEDIEGHLLHQAPVDEFRRPDPVEDDVEGHLLRQSPADGIIDDGLDYDRPR
jgi:hypothetical protein